MRKTQHSGAWRRRSCFSFWESGRAPRIYLHYPGKQGAEGAPAGGLSTCRAGSWSGRAVRLCAFQQSSLSGSGDRPALQLGRLGGRGVITPAAQAVRRQDSQAPRGSRAALYLENSKPQFGKVEWPGRAWTRPQGHSSGLSFWAKVGGGATGAEGGRWVLCLWVTVCDFQLLWGGSQTPQLSPLGARAARLMVPQKPLLSGRQVQLGFPRPHWAGGPRVSRQPALGQCLPRSMEPTS